MDKNQTQIQAKRKLLKLLADLPPDLQSVVAKLLNDSVPAESKSAITMPLRTFVKEAWPVYSPGKVFHDTYHIGAICEHLEALDSGQIKKLLVMCPPRHSKPVSVDSLVTTPAGRKPLREVLIGDSVLTHRGRFMPVTDFIDRGTEDCVKITTHSGRELICTPDHPILTARGWLEAVNIVIGDHVAIPSVTDDESDQPSERQIAEAQMAGYFVGDGCTKHGQATITVFDEIERDHIIKCCEKIGWSTWRRDDLGRVSVSDGVRPWLREIGLDGKGSREKQPPEFVIRNRKLHAPFLAAYWACDGTLNSKGKARKDLQITISSVNFQLIETCRWMLATAGIRARIRERVTNASSYKEGVHYWMLEVSSFSDAYRFREWMRPYLHSKKLSRLDEWDVIPTTFQETIFPDKVTSVEPAGKHHVACLTVSEDHSFAANDIAVRNSSLVSVMWPAWRWTLTPEKRYIFTSYSDKLSIRDSVACRAIVRSDWYQERWGHIVKLSGDQSTKTRFQNERMGWRIATTINSSGTGEGCDVLVMDDPHNIQKADSDAHIQQAIYNWDQVMASRVDDPNRAGSGYVVTMQRVRENDLAGHILKQGGYEVLCLPAEYEPTPYVSSIGWKDPRTNHGDPLWPERIDKKALAELKDRLGEYEYAGQYQQRPTPSGGGLFKKYHFRFWVDGTKEYEPVKMKNDKGEWVECRQTELPTEFDIRVHSWDCSFKDGLESDPVSGQVWWFAGANRFLVNCDRGRKDYSETKAAIRAMASEYAFDTILIEDKANGPAVISELQDEIEGILPWPPPGVALESKVSRARRVQPSVEAGNCYLPHPDMDGYDWVWDFINQHIFFGKAKNDDDVDAHCQAAIYAKNNSNVIMWGGVQDNGEVLNA